MALPAGADEITDRGRSLAEINCQKCHAIGETGESPLPPAPPFRQVATFYTLDEMVDGFMEGLAVKHQAMPDWDMTEEQAEAIASYIMSLAATAAPKTDLTPMPRGRELLATNCGACHALDPEGASPLAAAPPFRDVVKRYPPASLEEALAEGIVTGHEDMPEFSFDPDQITAIISYLDNLRAK